VTEPTEAFSTLDDFLLSMAEGVAYAQTELTRAGASNSSGSSVLYQLPRVDFELKMNLTVVQDQALSLRYSTLRPIRPNDRHLLFRPVSVEEASSTLDIAATVKGAFIAIPPNGGLPAPTMRTLVDATDPKAPVVGVIIRNTAGESLAGVEVQFNIDREESVAVNKSAGRAFSVATDTIFERGVLTTNESGTAQAVLRLSQTQQPGFLVIAVDALSRTETIVYEVNQ
jgi:hypothetical protein